MEKLQKNMSALKLRNGKRKRKRKQSPELLQSVRQRTLNKKGKRANGVGPPELDRNALALIMMQSKEPLPVFSQASRSAWRNVDLYRLDPKHKSAIRKFPNRNFVAVNLTKNQKKRVRKALENLMIHRSHGRFIMPNMPFSKYGVDIVQYSGNARTIGRFDISVNGIRLTEPISRNFKAPYLIWSYAPSTRRAVLTGRNMNKAGWIRTMFEPHSQWLP